MRTKVAVVIVILLGSLLSIFASAYTYNPSLKDSLPMPSNTPLMTCLKSTKLEVAGVPVWEILGGRALLIISKMSIDADGAPNAYHPEDIGIDFLSNGGRPGNWWALVTDNGRKDGRPVVQNSSAPFPGFYISTTSLFDATRPRIDTKRYIDSRLVPYFVLPKGRSGGARLGDLGVVINLRTHKLSPAIFADNGPSDTIGEGSIRLANNLGVNSNPKNGGVSSGIAYLVFPGSGNGRPKSPEEIESEAMEWFKRLGGIGMCRDCLQLKLKQL
ncbi:MAG: hypothetical protein HQ552_02065 [Desulfobacteraceae bacterium]|nr:hypothetical protein [Desulfobacteraceae bacterium]